MPKALVFAPLGRDALVASDLLREIAVVPEVCADLPTLCQRLGIEAAFVVVTEEAMRSADLRGIAAVVHEQPPWSDLPFIVLTQRGGGPERNPGAARLSEVLGNVTFVERPFHPTTFVSVAKTALRGRQRQYEARARMEALHEGEERLRTALLAGRLGSWELDLSTGILSTSATCKALFGRGAADQFAYDDLLASVHPDDRPAMQAAVKASIQTGADYAVEYRNIWPDGSVHWAEIRARVVRDSTGKSRMVGVSSDISDRKAAEQDLRHLNATLETRVIQRTAELEQAHATVLAEITQRERTEDMLRQAQKSEMIGQLTGGVAHDFNNLLMAVMANLELLRKHVTDARARRLLDGAERGAERGASLTQRLLAFARRQDLQVEPRSLSKLVLGMSDLLERSAGPEIEVVMDLPGSVPLALIDANQVELALLNLVVNARDAMQEGGIITVKVDVTTEIGAVDVAAGDYVRLAVVDAGSGMDAATLAKATDPFFSTKELGKGTGLGLSMVQGLAIQLNGALRITSEVGRGTTAEILLPVTGLAASSAAHDKLPELDKAARGSTIMVVDDDILIAMSTVDMLEDLGHTAIEVHSGEQALELLRKGQSIDLLITDYSMPKMTGVELAAAARQMQPDLPILLATGYAEMPKGAETDLPRLPKPYRQRDLANEIDRIIGT